MYLGMNRREMSGLLALIGLIVLGAAAQTYVHHNRGGALWVRYALDGPSRADTPRAARPDALSHDALGGAGTTSNSPSGGRLDLNLATIEDLETFSGIGPAKAQAIVDYRKQIGGFKNTGELLQVAGIGEAIMGGLEPHVFVATAKKPSEGLSSEAEASSPGLRALVPPQESFEEIFPDESPPASGLPDISATNPAPVNINTASVDLLQTLWNVGPQKADAIVRWRRLHGPFRRPEDLMNVPGIGAETLTRNRSMIRVK